jgi:cytochrome c-type biogenesis protein CcmH
MSLWFVFALMTAAAVFAVLWPLSRDPRLASGEDARVYEDQLTELSRERETGLISAAEAENLRTEVARRFLHATQQNTQPLPVAATAWRRRAVMGIALLALPAFALAVYLRVGAPHLPAAPIASRVMPATEQTPINELVARVEAHLERSPGDARGWEVLAPVYARLGRHDDAVKARRNVLRLSGANAQREADLGEALTAQANGVVTADAKQAFERALALDASEAKARFFLGLAAEQDGRPAEAARMWRALLADAPQDAPWIGYLRAAIARVDPSAAAGEGGPTQDDVAAAAAMDPDQRAQMIRGMVDRLASRLKDNANDLDGWLRLIRSYVVLGEVDNAREAATNARRSIGDDADKLRRIEELSRALGLAG